MHTALVGYGFAGKTFHAPLIQATPLLELVAVASRDPAKVESDLGGIPVVDDPMALAAADDVDLVVIASPNASHFPLALRALQAGKHVVVDKPFTVHLDEARELSQLANQNGLILSVFQNRRWDSDYLSVRAALREESIGRVSHFESHIDRFRPQVRRRWREDPGPGAGLWFDLGPHLVDQVVELFGIPERVQADFALQRDGALTEDWAHVILQYGSMRAILHASVLAAGGHRRFMVHGDRGTLIKSLGDQQESQLIAGLKPGAPGWGVDPDPLIFIDAAGSHQAREALSGDQREYYHRIGSAIIEGAPNPVTAAQAIVTMSIVEAAAMSARLGCSVELPLTDSERTAWRPSALT